MLTLLRDDLNRELPLGIPISYKVNIFKNPKVVQILEGMIYYINEHIPQT